MPSRYAQSMSNFVAYLTSLLQLFTVQEDFYDVPTSTLSPVQIREKLADVAVGVIGADKRAAVLDLLAHKTTPNGGVAVTDDLKYLIKYARQNSIHGSPTVLWDGECCRLQGWRSH